MQRFIVILEIRIQCIMNQYKLLQFNFYYSYQLAQLLQVNILQTNATFTPTDGLLELTLDRKHTFRPATIHNISGGEYNGSTGLMRVTVADHGFLMVILLRLLMVELRLLVTNGWQCIQPCISKSIRPLSNKWMDS